MSNDQVEELAAFSDVRAFLATLVPAEIARRLKIAWMPDDSLCVKE